eukprot:gene11558-11702_t
MQQLHQWCSRQPFRLEVCCSARPSRRGNPNTSGRRWGHINRNSDTPIRRYLKGTLALKDTLLDQSLACAPDLSSVSELEVQALVDPNYELLGELEGSQFWHLITTYPTLLLQGSVFRAGKAILFLKELGWTDLEIKSLVIPYHAAILQMDDEQQLQPVLQYMTQECGMSMPAVKDFLHQHPQVLYSQHYKQQIRQLRRRQLQLALGSL